MHSLAIDASDRIILNASSYNPSGHLEPVLMRYTSSGALDSSFGAGSGLVIFHHNSNGVAGALANAKEDQAKGLKIDSQSRLLLSGYSVNASGGSEPVLWRVLSDGTSDSSFGVSGALIYHANLPGLSGLSASTKNDRLGNLVIDSRGRTVVGGSSVNASGRSEVITLRFFADGSPDL